jgi:tetratricopeptide (TPR) repeat protein
MSESVNNMLRKAEQALLRGETLVALMQLETAYQLEPLPVVKSRLAYCLAKERRQFQRAVVLCKEALNAESANPEHYYHLGRTCLLARQKRQAISAFRKGLKVKRYQPIIDELSRLGLRQEPVFNALPREHLLNRSLGVLLNRVGLR